MFMFVFGVKGVNFIFAVLAFNQSVIMFSSICIKVCVRAIRVRFQWPVRPELVPVLKAGSDREYFVSPLDGMLVYLKVTPSSIFTGTHLYTLMKRGTVKVKCLSLEHDTAPRTARSEVQCINH